MILLGKMSAGKISAGFYSQIVKSKWDANTANAQHCKPSLHASSSYACAISSYSRESWHQIWSALLDSGANIGVFDPAVEDAMVNTTKSRMKIQVADKDFMQGRLDGTLHMLVVDPSTGEFANNGKVFSYKMTTVDAVAKNLFSIDDLYKEQGYNLILRQPDFETGISELFKPATGNQPLSAAISIPLQYDYKDGGFWIDCVLPDKDGKVNKHRRTLLAAYHEDMRNGATAAKSEVFMADEEVVAFVAQAHLCEAVTEIVLGQHKGVVRSICGVMWYPQRFLILSCRGCSTSGSQAPTLWVALIHSWAAKETYLYVLWGLLDGQDHFPLVNQSSM